MILYLFEIFALSMVIILPFFMRAKKKPGTIKIPKNHSDTSEARYAINEKGFLEEIRHDKMSKHIH
jgi:hypothetical protein